MLQNSIDFQCEIVERKTRFEMKKAAERAHILEGLKTALDFIDEVISIIRSSADVSTAKENLSERFGLDDIQTTAIVQMQLGKLANLEKQKILDELAEKLEFIKECQAILDSKERILDIVKTESLNLRDKYSDDRRTEISAVSGEVDIEDLIPEEECVITKTVNGYIKRMAVDTYSVQHKGGRGKMGMRTREDDMIENMMTCSSHDNIMLFTNFGRVYKLKAYEIPEATSTNSKGMNVVNLLALQAGISIKPATAAQELFPYLEKLSMVLSCAEADDESFICMVTRKGTIKRTKITEFRNIRKTGIIALELNEGDELSFVSLTDGKKDIYVATKKGRGIRFEETQVRPMGRTACGVRAIKLTGDDEVVAMDICDDNSTLLTVTETGFGRKSPISDYRVQSRGGKGTTNYRTEKYGDVANVICVDDDEDVIMISSDGIIIRIPVCEISTFARPSKGVRVMRVEGDAKVLSVATATHDEEEVNALPEAPDADAADVGDSDIAVDNDTENEE